MRNTIIGLKELREKVDAFISQVEEGKSFIVVRRSKPIFKISPPTDEPELWEPVIDFTKIKRGGISLKKILSLL